MRRIFDESPPNSLRMAGRAFSGFAHPETEKIHHPRAMSPETRTDLLFLTAMSYTQIYGMWGTGAMKTLLPGKEISSLDDATLEANSPQQLEAKLRAAAAYVPSVEFRVNYIFTIQEQLQAGRPVPRIVLLSDGDQPNIPQDLYETFCYWFLKNSSPAEMAQAFESRFDALLNLTAWEACHAAKQKGENRSSRQIYEEIIDHALEDAEVVLEPLLSRAPTPDRALALKTVVYALLAREGFTPDGFFFTVNHNAAVAPLDYFTDASCRTFRANPNGYMQLVAEGLLISIERFWREREGGTLAQMQSTLEVIQYLEDITMFLSQCGTAFNKLLP